MSAFQGLAATPAGVLLVHDFGTHLGQAVAVPSVSAVTKDPVVRYLNAHTAEVRGSRGPRYAHSLLPMAADVGGREHSLDLSLKRSGGSFVPVADPGGISLAGTLSGGASLGSAGVRVWMEGQDVRGTQLTGSSVFFAGVELDVDAAVSPTPGGVEFFASLRSRLSPRTLRYRVALPAGASLRAVGSGAEVVRGGSVLARVSAPTATDAQGQSLPVSLTVVGDAISVAVSITEGDVAYPVLVDPVVNQEEHAENWAFKQGYWSSPGKFVAASGPFVALNPGGFEVPKGAATIKGPGTPVAMWVWTPPHGETLGLVTVSWGLGYTPEETPKNAERYTGWIDAGCGGLETYQGVHDGFSFYAFKPGGKCEAPDVVTVGYEGADAVENELRGVDSVDPIILTETKRIKTEEYGHNHRAMPNIVSVSCGGSVNCATGNESSSHTDVEIGGNPGLQLTRTYNSQLAATQSTPGPFGYGWTASYGAYAQHEEIFCERHTKEGTEHYLCADYLVVHEAEGGTVTFETGGTGWHPCGLNVQASLYETGGGEFYYTLPGGTRLTFSSTGELLKEENSDGNATTLSYESGRLTKVEEPAKRTLTFAYNSEGLVKEAKSAQGTVEYKYTSKNLTEVSDVEKHAWKYAYNSSHEMTSETDPLSHVTTREYDSSDRVISEEDPMKRKRTWKYEPTESGTETKVTQPNGSTTVMEFNTFFQLKGITQASGTPLAAKTTYEYDKDGDLIATTDPNKHTTKYEYDDEYNRISETNADGDETKWTYNTEHEVVSATTPKGETTTIKRNEHGNPETIERAAPGSTTQTTTYKYAAKQELESVTGPLGRKWKYEYDGYGDKTAEIDPEGDKRTWSYNTASQETSTVSPRGNVTGGEPSKFTTSTERDAEGRPLKITEPEAAGAGKPVDRTPATISGTALEGQTLTAGTGIWEGSPADLRLSVAGVQPSGGKLLHNPWCYRLDAVVELRRARLHVSRDRDRHELERLCREHIRADGRRLGDRAARLFLLVWVCWGSEWGV